MRLVEVALNNEKVRQVTTASVYDGSVLSFVRFLWWKGILSRFWVGRKDLVEWTLDTPTKEVS
jgi:hypothetical protein